MPNVPTDRRPPSKRVCGARARTPARLAPATGLAHAVAGVARRRLRRASGARGCGVRPRRVRTAERLARPRDHRRERRPRDPEGHRAAEPLGASDLRQAANYLNEEFSGLPLHRAREAVLERINAERSLFDAIRQRALQLATSTFSDLPDDRPMYVEGAASLLDDATGLTVQTLQALLQMIEEKQKLLELLNEYIDGPA